jgi:Ubiquitin carboxyl-terminal hydrolase
MSEFARKGGVKGGHSLSVDSRLSNTPIHHPIHYNHHAPTQEQWPKGLKNVGNTCYANAALQCLLSTALTNALLDPKVVPLLRSYSSNASLLAQGSGSVDEDDTDRDQARKKAVETERIRRKEHEASLMQDNCRWLTRELTSITQLYTQNSETEQNSRSYMSWLQSSSSRQVDAVVDPGNITRHPNRLSTCLQPYHQEDAHEFLRALLSTLVMNGRNKQLSSLFDGLLESAVTCQSCGRASLTRDRYMDLSLNINDPEVSTLDDALLEYTKTEVLQGDNCVFCPKCDKKRTATKGLRLATAPSILVCHLKRFAFNSCGRLIRLHKHVKFAETLQIGDYMSSLNKAKPPPYDLVGILVHQGQTCASGHYIAFVKKNGEWYRCNDSVVTKVDQATVFEQQAYILMYEVAEMRDPRGGTPPASVGNEMPELFNDEDDAEISKDGVNSRSSASTYRSSHTGCSQQPYKKFLNFLYGRDGITRFLADMCCDTTDFREPQTHELTRETHHRGLSPDIIDNANGIRKTYSSGRLANRKKKSANVRSQTAPRQRTSSDYYPSSGMVESPRTARSSFADGRSSSFHDRRSKQRSHQGDRRSVTGSTEQFSRSALNLAGPGDLPPLPRPRPKSTASRSKLSATG